MIFYYCLFIYASCFTLFRFIFTWFCCCLLKSRDEIPLFFFFHFYFCTFFLPVIDFDKIFYAFVFAPSSIFRRHWYNSLFKNNFRFKIFFIKNLFKIVQFKNKRNDENPASFQMKVWLLFLDLISDLWVDRNYLIWISQISLKKEKRKKKIIFDDYLLQILFTSE